MGNDMEIERLEAQVRDLQAAFESVPRTPGIQGAEKQWFAAYNPSGVAIPGYSLVRSTNLAANGLYTVALPNADSQLGLFVCSADGIPAGGYGAVSRDWPLPVKYGGAAPSYMDQRGSANGSAVLTASKKGMVVVGVDTGNTLAWVVAVMLITVSGYAFGGQNSSGYPQQATTAYDPSADTWAGKANMPGVTTRMGSCAMGAACLATNGSSAFSPYTLTRALYKLESEAWATMTQSPTPAREQPTLQPLADKAYLCGGDTGAGGGLQDCDEYTVDAWASKTSMPTPARYGPGGGTIGSSVYVVGGRSGGGPWTYYADCDQYTPDTWASVTDMPAPARYRLASASLSDKLYAIGGETSTAQSRDCDEFDGSSWVSKTDMPLPARSGSGCFALESLVYVFGSVASGNDVDAFDPAADSWTSKTNQTMYAFPGAGAPA